MRSVAQSGYVIRGLSSSVSCLVHLEQSRQGSRKKPVTGSRTVRCPSLSEMISLSPFTDHVKQGTVSQVEAEQMRLEKGVFDVFYGPIYDNEGNLRVGEGESMKDETMLNHFDWYVEGVIIDEE